MGRIRRRRGLAVAGPLCAGLAVLLLMTAAHGDEASITGEGGNIRPLAGRSAVRLVEADVQVRILEPTAGERRRLSDSAALPADSMDNDQPWAAVECTFVLKNTGAATTAKMGFPEETWVGSGDDGKPLPGPYRGFVSFQSWVDGEPWETTVSEWQPVGKLGYDQLRWRMKDVPFAANQTRTVRDAYVMELGYAGGSADWFRYTLSTGASWQGPVGRERVTLDLSGLRTRQLVSATPQSGLLPPATDKVVWEWRNFEPQGETAEVRAEFLRGHHTVVTRQMHSWLGVEAGQMPRRKGVTMVPADALLGQYAGDEVLWEPSGKRLVSHSGDAGVGVVIASGSKTVRVHGKPVQLPTPAYLARTPAGYSNPDLMDGDGTTLFVPLEATVKALGGKLFRLYRNGPLCLSFPPQDRKH